MTRSSLGEFEQFVLLALLRLRPNAYGVTIRREVSARAGREISIGQLYTALDRLEDKGYVSSRRGEPTPSRGGRAKRYFDIEAPGLLALDEARARAERTWNDLAPGGLPA